MKSGPLRAPAGASSLATDRVSAGQTIESSNAVRFLTRLVSEWENGTLRFDKPGECLLGVFRHDLLIAIGGVSRDPYSNPDTGRLRRVYVAPSMRRHNVGKALVERLLEHAAAHFQQVHLTTDTPEAAAFYLRCGFHQITNGTATHAKSLVPGVTGP
ncbi:GNAT family N-acetyltransferase [Pseudomonas edaphica]|uniref:GNAT family N-acetyltransferase n=1 Tax=Pseudomonas edaphica TaxID=2006980 RepID=A0A7Y8KD33_9PSED|nr:GNAT family N-acetyltransferase [Pseudomonas sp. IPO3747]NWE07373.1 GNAT family N-acetyltransferase [Pseudomonas edaphica]NWE83425.1 GNAT family N-acetyltransferase [Pseudomonas edaphica]